MTGPVTRKIELARQIEEIERTIGEPAPAGSQRQAGERLERRRAILETLRFNARYEHLFRAWLAERRGDGLRFRFVRGQLCWSSQVAPEVWNEIDIDTANTFLARFDAPAKEDANA